MCIPYIIPDPPPKKRPRKSGLIAHSSPPKSPNLQPAFIEISPRLTYVASPKPDRSPIPPRAHLSAMKPPRAPETAFLEGFIAGEEASRQEEGRVPKEETQPAEPKPKSTTPPSQASPKPVKVASPRMNEKSPPQQPQSTPTPLAKPPPPPPPSTARNPHPRIIPTLISPPLPHQHPPPTRSPYSYTHRPPHRTRSQSPNSTISHRSYERLKQNLKTLFERVKLLEAEKECREAEVRRRKRGWELGMGAGRREGRREGSLIRERRTEGSLIRDRRERERGREAERWDWEGGGLGRL